MPVALIRRPWVLMISVLPVVCLLAIWVGHLHNSVRVAPQVRYLGSGQINWHGRISYGNTFLISNSSPREICFFLTDFQSKLADKWVSVPASPSMNLVRIGGLGPFKSETFVIEPPTGVTSPWRVGISTVFEMKGVMAYWTTVKICWKQLRGRGVARVVWPQRIGGFDMPVEVVSAEVTSE